MKLCEIVYPDVNGKHTVKTYTRQQILDEYWDYWKSAMLKAMATPNTLAFGMTEEELLTEDNCIDDWITTNWAIEVEQLTQ